MNRAGFERSINEDGSKDTFSMWLSCSITYVNFSTRFLVWKALVAFRCVSDLGPHLDLRNLSGCLQPLCTTPLTHAHHSPNSKSINFALVLQLTYVVVSRMTVPECFCNSFSRTT